jgi:hypothetical protein
MTQRILMIAYHFPPIQGSSGLQRTLSFARYLPCFGWEPLILTTSPTAYPKVSDDQLADIPPDLHVTRAFALDSARHLSIAGRYMQFTALPDRWITWLVGAVPNGLRLIRKYKPAVLWSTQPIPTAHLIGLALHQLTGVPWIADFRDPMTEVDPITGKNWPPDPKAWRARRAIERRALTHSTKTVFVTHGSLEIHRERYPALAGSHWSVIGNGYDEESFSDAENLAPPRKAQRDQLVLVHSGLLYPTPDRDPSAFFTAIRLLKEKGCLSATNLRIVLRASGHDDRYRKQIIEHGIDDIVFLEPAVGYREALAEMVSADALLLFQGYASNFAIPAKFYEYLRARRPIFALVDAKGDTAESLRKAGVGRMVPLDSSAEIAAGLNDFLIGLRGGVEPVASDAEIAGHSRKSKTAELAALLDSLIGAAEATREREAELVRNSS